jgi:processive 1,2-diacylglycerol beta-glucosyltransferase
VEATHPLLRFREKASWLGFEQAPGAVEGSEVEKRAVILSGSLGLGHAAMAAVLSSTLEERGWRTRTLDTMALLGPVAGRLGEGVFRRLTAMPTLYDGLHFSHLRTGSRLSVAMDALATRKLLPALRRQLDAEPADLVISVFSTGAAAMARLGARYTQTSTMVLCTDTTVHSGWVHPHVDRYLVTSLPAASSVRRFLPGAEIAIVPAPVRRQFFAAPSKSDARRAHAISDTARCVLLMGGGWGLGPLHHVARSLAGAGVEVIAVAGRNARLHRRLTQLAASTPRVHAFGYVDSIDELMAASDLVVTTPGANTIAEARVIGRPLALLDVMPGHGRENIQHELERGHAEVCSPEPPLLVPAVLAMLERETTAPPPAGERRNRFPDALGAVMRSMGLDPLASLDPQALDVDTARVRSTT